MLAILTYQFSQRRQCWRIPSDDRVSCLHRLLCWTQTQPVEPLSNILCFLASHAAAWDAYGATKLQSFGQPDTFSKGGTGGGGPYRSVNVPEELNLSVGVVCNLARQNINRTWRRDRRGQMDTGVEASFASAGKPSGRSAGSRNPVLRSSEKQLTDSKGCKQIISKFSVQQSGPRLRLGEVRPAGVRGDCCWAAWNVLEGRAAAVSRCAGPHRRSARCRAVSARHHDGFTMSAGRKHFLPHKIPPPLGFRFFVAGSKSAIRQVAYHLPLPGTAQESSRQRPH